VTSAKKKEDLLKVRWESHEDGLIREHWETQVSVAEIVSLLPGRSKTSVKRRASELGVKRPSSRPHPGRIVSPLIARDGVVGKACTYCLEWKPFENFSRHSTSNGGRRNQCTTCEGRRAYANDPGACIRKVRSYQKKNPALMKRYRENARAMRVLRIGTNKLDNVAVRALFDLYDQRCAYCRERVADSIDHVIPLSRGGEHTIDNVLPACLPCNRSKHTKSLEEWLKTRKGA